MAMPIVRGGTKPPSSAHIVLDIVGCHRYADDTDDWWLSLHRTLLRASVPDIAFAGRIWANLLHSYKESDWPSEHWKDLQGTLMESALHSKDDGTGGKRSDYL